MKKVDWVMVTLGAVAGILLIAGAWSFWSYNDSLRRKDAETREIEYQTSRRATRIHSVSLDNGGLIIQTEDGVVFRGICHSQQIQLNKDVIIGLRRTASGIWEIVIEDKPGSK